MSLYLQILKQNGITPNFWCSQEYFDKAGLEEKQGIGKIGVLDPNCPSMPVFPILHIWPYGREGKIILDCSSVWSDFEDGPVVDRELLIEEGRIKFLDYEFIYDQRNFLNMSGKKWAVFRKNSRKWLRGKDPEKIAFIPIAGQHWNSMIGEVLLDWLEAQGEDEEIHDSDTMLKFLYEGQNRFGLFYGDELKAVLAYDYNWEYINFRYCVCRKEPWLSEYARLRFYLDSSIQQDSRLVNDGGSLDNQGLYFFKQKMNPVEIRKRYSWR